MAQVPYAIIVAWAFLLTPWCGWHWLPDPGSNLVCCSLILEKDAFPIVVYACGYVFCNDQDIGFGTL